MTLPDGGASWRHYILYYLKWRFSLYALRLTEILLSAFNLWLRLQTVFQLSSPLVSYSIPGSFAASGILSTSHCIRTQATLPKLRTLPMLRRALPSGFSSCVVGLNSRHSSYGNPNAIDEIVAYTSLPFWNADMSEGSCDTVAVIFGNHVQKGSQVLSRLTAAAAFYRCRSDHTATVEQINFNIMSQRPTDAISASFNILSYHTP